MFCRTFPRNFFFYLFLFLCKFFSVHPFLFADQLNSVLGPSVNKNTIWVGNQVVLPTIQILVMAGHADSQNILGEGTSGEAVALRGELPMDSNISDELFWNLKVVGALVRLGRKNGLEINSYDPEIRTIVDENDYKTNWSKGSREASNGVYVLEIHFDSYGDDGLGSGLIPPLSTQLNNIDESLAQSFGRYPLFFRGGLGAPRRQIRILEIGKLEGDLEKNLRDVNLRQTTIDQIARRIIEAIKLGMKQENSFNPMLQEGDIFHPGLNR